MEASPTPTSHAPTSQILKSQGLTLSFTSSKTLLIEVLHWLSPDKGLHGRRARISVFSKKITGLCRNWH